MRQGFGGNKTESATQRATKALGRIVPVLDQFDLENSVLISSGAHKKASAEKDIPFLITELQNFDGFDKISGRMQSFPTTDILSQ